MAASNISFSPLHYGSSNVPWSNSNISHMLSSHLYPKLTAMECEVSEICDCLVISEKHTKHHQVSYSSSVLASFSLVANTMTKTTYVEETTDFILHFLMAIYHWVKKMQGLKTRTCRQKCFQLHIAFLFKKALTQSRISTAGTMKDANYCLTHSLSYNYIAVFIYPNISFSWNNATHSCMDTATSIKTIRINKTPRHIHKPI